MAEGGGIVAVGERGWWNEGRVREDLVVWMQWRGGYVVNVQSKEIDRGFLIVDESWWKEGYVYKFQDYDDPALTYPCEDEIDRA